MKKWAYLIGGIVIGAMVATTGSALAEQVKSMIGKKVTGELSIVVNGKALQDKGAVIDGKTNVPVRSFSQALGVSVDVQGNKIVVTSNESTSKDGVSMENPNSGKSKSSLESRKDYLENVEIKPLAEKKNEIKKSIEKSKANADEYKAYLINQKRIYEEMIQQMKEPGNTAATAADIKLRQDQLNEVNSLLANDTYAATYNEQISKYENELKTIDDNIAKYTKELEQVNAALAALENK